MNTIRYSSEVSFQKFKHLDVHIDTKHNAVWLFFNPRPRSCFTLTLLRELDKFQSILKHHDGKLACNGQQIDVQFSIISSRNSVFSFGGDIDYFLSCIANKDKAKLKEYAKACIDAVYFNHIGRELDMTTISLIHGNALGGGFEAALSSHVLIAEHDVELGLPEVLFNLFPGMGAYDLLSRRVSPVTAERMILDGKLYKSEDLYSRGIIDILADVGEGRSAVNAFMHTHRHRLNSMRSMTKIRNRVNRIDYRQLIDIGDVWVDAAFNLSERDVHVMQRLVYSQNRFANKYAQQPASAMTNL